MAAQRKTDNRAAAPDTWRWVAIVAVLLAALANAFYYSPSFSDLRPVWNGTRAFLFDRASPYSASVTAANSQLFHATSEEFPRDEEQFAYPLHAIYLFVPFAVLPFRAARIALTLLGAALSIASVKWWTGTFRTDYALLLLAAYPVMLGLSIQQPTLLFAAFLAAAIHFMRAERPGPAGVLLALGTGKPQLLLCVLLPVALWVSGDWKRRKGLAISFAAALAGMLALSLLAEPSWPAEWIHALRVYSWYAGSSLPTEFLGRSLGLIVSALALGAGLHACWKGRENHQQTLAISIGTIFLILAFQPYNEILLIAPVLWIERLAAQHKGALPLAFLLARFALLELFLGTLAGAAIEAVFPSTIHLVQALLGGFTKIVPFAIFLALVSAGYERPKAAAGRW